MINVINFPSKDAHRLKLILMLNGTIDGMDNYYADIDATMEELCKLEEEVSKIETMYSSVLKEYSKSCEHKKMEARFLAYCKEATAHWDGDKKMLVFHIPSWEEEENDE